MDEIARLIGELGVEITADSTGLAQEIHTQVEAAVREAATSQLALSVDTAQLARQLQKAIKEAKAEVGNLKVGVELNDNGFLAAVEAEVRKAQVLGSSIKFSVDLGVAGIDQEQMAAEVRKSLAKAQALIPALQVKIELDDTGLLTSVKVAVAAVQRAAANVKLGFDLDVTGLAAKVKLAAKLVAEENPIEPKVDPKTARADFEKFSKELTSKLGDLRTSMNGFASGFFSSIFQVSKWSSIIVGASQAAVSVIQLSGALGVVPGLLFSAVGAIAALKIGTQGFGQAVKDIGTAQFGADLAKLAPSARDTAQAIASIKPSLTQLKLDVQQQLFEGFGNTIRNLSGQLLPILNTGLSGFATTLNTTAHQLDSFFSAASVKADLAGTFNTAQASVFNLGQALPAVLSIFRDLTVVGSQAFANVTAGAGAAAAKVADFVAQSRQSGALANFIQGGISAFHQLFDIIGNVLVIVNDLLGAIGGGGILGLLLQLTTTLKNFLSSAAGTAALEGLGKAMQQIAASAGQVFLKLLESVGQILADHAPDIAAFAKALGDNLVSAINVLTPIISGLLSAIGAHPELFANIALGAIALAGALNVIVPIATTVAALIAAGTVGLVAAIVAAVVAAVILIILNFDKIKEAIGTALGAIGAFFVFLGTTIADAFQSSVAFVEGIWNGVVSFFVGIGTAIGSAVSGAVSAIGQFFADGFNAVIGFVSGVITSIVNFFVALPGQIGAFIASIPALAAASIQQLVFDFGFAVGAILRFFIDLPSNIISAVTSLVDGFTAFTIDAGNALINGFIAGVNAVVTFLTTFPALALNAILSLQQSIIDWAVGVWNNALAFFVNGVNSVVNFTLALPGNIINAIGSLQLRIGLWALGVWNSARDGFVNGVSAVVNFVTALPGQVVNAIGNLGSRLYQVGVDALAGLLNGLKSIASNILHWVSGLVGDILHGFTSGFDSHSPSRETYSIGQDVAQGLANALRDSRDLVASAAGDLATAGLDGLSPILNPTVNTAALATSIGAAGSQLTANGQTGVNYTVQQTNVMQQGADVNQFADAVLRNGAAALANGSSLLGVSQQGTQVGINPNFLAVSGV